MPSDESEPLARTIIMDTLYAILVGYAVFQVIDQLTDGELSREVSLWLYRMRGNVLARMDKVQAFNKEKNHMLWQAMETVEEATEGGE